MNKEYLPSKKFIATVSIIVIVFLIVFGVSKLAVFFKNKLGDKAPTKLLVKDLVQQDTNNNGIPDWEESLWGLNPNENGPSNKEFILAERAKLAKNQPAQEGTPEAVENTELAKEFFAVLMSLQQSGNLDDGSIKSISEALGQKIVAAPINPIYTRDMLDKQAPTEAATEAYLKNVGKLMQQYQDKDMGNELNYISQGLMRNDPQATALAGNIAKSYRSLGQELMKIPVPTSVIDHHLAMANDYERVAQSIDGLTQILTNPIIGMKAVINYNKYTDALVADIENLTDIY